MSTISKTFEPKPATPATIHADPRRSGGELTPAVIASFQEHFEARPAYRLARNAVTQAPVDDVALNRQVVTATDQTFSHKLDDWTATNQKKSGRCWLFAGLNLLRVGAMKAMNLKDFEFSQNHLLFWDKFERSNYFLEAIIETAGSPQDDRTVAFLLSRPLEDGGQWNMFVNLVRKHGLVPKAAMPESQSSSDTRRMNELLIRKLREGARVLRGMRASGAPMEAARAAKQELLRVIHRILTIHLGTPPAEFDWQWNDKDKAFHREGVVTPQEFARRHVALPLDDYACLVHDPRPSNPPNLTYTVQYLGNVVGGEIVKYLNVPIQVMKDAARRALVEGRPVWFGCDVGKMMRRDRGLWDARLFEYDVLYDTTFPLTKAERLEYHESLMTHAMLFTGVDVLDGRTRRWRVENSWGEEDGQKGFFVMNDSWFDEYVFEVAAPRSDLPPELAAALQLPPRVLPPWDPMGALARG
jgi:bleomycin hydrolase